MACFEKGRATLPLRIDIICDSGPVEPPLRTNSHTLSTAKIPDPTTTLGVEPDSRR